MDGQSDWSLTLHLLEEGQELVVSVSRHALGNNLAGRHVERAAKSVVVPCRL
jgi:hypothetical protein